LGSAEQIAFVGDVCLDEIGHMVGGWMKAQHAEKTLRPV
jgi:hypothetical protein